jgi:16S rRNA (adenine1518-N6/adenine1519-N6)-dimethyltransferase
VASRVRWGQCFLVDGEAVARIVEWAAIDGLPVVEIGPGRGALTGLLRQRSSSLTLVEIDPALAAELELRYRDDPRVTVVRADALRVDWASLVAPGFTVVSNLPYESGTAIVASLLEKRGLVRELVVMLQKEVVSRLAAAPGSKTYGGLSVIVQMLADVEKGMVLAPRSFRPRPAVESQMVRLRPLAAPRFELGDEAEFAPLVHAAFAQRRKMLRNNLGRAVESRFGAGAAERVLAEAAVAGDVRPEALSVEQFAALTRAVVRLRDEAGAAARADEAPAAASTEHPGRA